MQPFTQTFEDTKYVFRGCYNTQRQIVQWPKEKEQKNKHWSTNLLLVYRKLKIE
jgi:hypothetical protein